MKNNLLKRVAVIALSLLFASAGTANSFAQDSSYGISMSPPNQKIVLMPGEQYTGTFSITNVSDEVNFDYVANVTPFYVDENYSNIFDKPSSYTQITEWTTINVEKGTLLPGGSQDIVFNINVPYDAPAGGQYMTITVTSDEQLNQEDKGKTSAGLITKQAMAHVVFAEIAGTTQHSGEVVDANVPGFLFSGKIAGTSTIKNTGNVHSDATYKLQVFPLFSNEEVYTNVENPDTKTILPDRALYNTTSWEETPSIGIFNVIYTAEFEGVTTEVKKMVIICPLWLLIIIIIAIIALIVWLYTRSKSRKK